MIKKISKILLALIGLQVSINAEIIYFEKALQREESQVLEQNEYFSQDAKIKKDFDDVRIFLGTIRLEEGEELTIYKRKWTTAYCCGSDSNGYQKNQGERGRFRIEIDYDKFSQNEYFRTYFSGPNWNEVREGEGLDYHGSMWPVEGPATIKIHITPAWYIGSKYDQSRGLDTFKPLTPEQYCRISFNKTLSSHRADQNQLQALVLPKGVPGMSVIMESSDDLVNWTRDTLGQKPTANRPKFFRLRAVKE